MKPQRSRHGQKPSTPSPRNSRTRSPNPGPNSKPGRGGSGGQRAQRDAHPAQSPPGRSDRRAKPKGGLGQARSGQTKKRATTRAESEPHALRPQQPSRPIRASNQSDSSSGSFFGVKRRPGASDPNDGRPSRPAPRRPSAAPSGHHRPRRPKPAPLPRVPPGKQRLQRVLADAGVASRRECERLIEQGHVEVNGQVVTRMPVLVDPRRDRVRVDGQHVRLIDPKRELVYVMLHKPERVLCTTRDATPAEEGGRRTVLDLLDQDLGARIYPVGRLDYHATGIVLLTNDGDLTNRLTHARYGVTQTYRVWAAGKVTRDTLDMLRRRIGSREALDDSGMPTGGVRVDITPGTELSTGDVSNSTVLEITVREGKRENIADMLLACGCPVKKMVRVAIGPLRMKGVGSGRWRKLSHDEVALLHEAAYSRENLPAVAPPPSQPSPRTVKGEKERE